MFRKLFSIFRKKKKEDSKFHPPSGEAVANVPTAGVAVGAGVGAAQPGEAISQTNPVPKGEPVDSPPLQPTAPENPAPEQPEPTVEIPAPSPVDTPEQPSTEPPAIPTQEEPSIPVEPQPQPTEPVEQPPAEEDPTNPGNPTAPTL